MTSRLKDHFQKIFVINLPQKPDRRERVIRHLAERGLAEPEELTFVRAISGDHCTPPTYFVAGGGAWGCLQTHLRIVQDAIMDGLENYLVLEDDVLFHATAGRDLRRLMAEVPPDWGQLYLGGQHLKPPENLGGKPFVYRCLNINRTHAYALNKKAFTAFHQHISHAPDYIAKGAWHVDHQLGLAHERKAWNTYAPTWWLAGQVEGTSSISGRVVPDFWWHYQGYSEHLPFVHFEEPPDASWNDLLVGNLHFGRNLKPGSFEDVGLDNCVGSPARLLDFLRIIAREAMDHWKIPAICHRDILPDQVRLLWPAGVKSFDPEQTARLRNYPANNLFTHPLNEIARFEEILG